MKKVLIAPFYKIEQSGGLNYWWTFDNLRERYFKNRRRQAARELVLPDGGDYLFLIPLSAAAASSYAEFADELYISGDLPVHFSFAGGFYTDDSQNDEARAVRDELDFCLAEAFIRADKPIYFEQRGKQILEILKRNKNPFALSEEARKVLLMDAAPLYLADRNSGIFINESYVNAVVAAGGAPLSMIYDDEVIAECASLFERLMVIGEGYKIAPQLARYSANLTMEARQRRDEFDHKLYERFAEEGKRILGICLGLQAFNSYEGGGTLRDFRLQNGHEHMFTAHYVSSPPGSVLNELFGTRYLVNSRHNDCIGRLAEGFAVTAYADDGTIEAIEHKSKKVSAMQWHPERSVGAGRIPVGGADMLVLFEELLLGD